MSRETLNETPNTEETSPVLGGNENNLGNYFVKPNTSVDLLSTGCKIFDLVLGGGYPIGRIVNIIGDASTGKSLLAIEACATFANKYPTGKIWYNEAEAAFERNYAKELGMPIDRVSFVNTTPTVEEFFDDLENKANSLGNDECGLYIIDSLDALSDKAELEREIGDSSFGAAKAKKLSELFRRMVKKLETKKLLILIISQVRENIGVTFGAKYTRSGGKALDFYASQKIMLSQIKTLKKTHKGVERPYGVRIRAKCTKNKIGQPYRECEYEIIFGYGIDSVSANIDWLEEVKVLSKEEAKENYKLMETLTDEEFKDFEDKLNKQVEEKWYDIEKDFTPKRKKYNL